MLEIKDLNKYYGKLQVLDHVSFTARKHEILGFLGPNGAGKSTTFNIVSGCLSADGGSATLNGEAILNGADKVRARIGYLPERPPLYDDMTVGEYLDFVAQLKGLSKQERNEAIERSARQAGCSTVLPRLIENLSKGFRQRVGMAQALLGDPELLIFDEPTEGLDPRQMLAVRRLMRDLTAEHGVLFSSHNLAEVAAVADSVVIIDHGRIVANKSAAALWARSLETTSVELSVAAPAQRVSRLLKGIEGVSNLELLSESEGIAHFSLNTRDGLACRKRIFFVLARNDLTLLRLSSAAATLEETFLDLTGAQDGTGTRDDAEGESTHEKPGRKRGDAGAGRDGAEGGRKRL